MELDGKVELNAAGERSPDSRSYEAVGRVVLDQSDVLMAIWDGKSEHGEGGTGQVVTEALERGIPVIWIRWTDPQSWQVLLPRRLLVRRSADMVEDWARLTELVHNLLTPPEVKSASHSEAASDLREEYFCERRRSGFPLLDHLWPLFRNIVTWSVFSSKCATQVPEDASSQKRSSACGVAKPLLRHAVDPAFAQIDRAYLCHYDWANELSIFYANRYRSSFLANYLLGAFAVLFALLGILIEKNDGFKKTFIVVELILIAAVLLITYLGLFRRWHERWIDYRMLAERLRLARFLALFGGGGQPVSMPAHLASYGNPAATWMHWHYRAIERAAGLPSVVFDQRYLAACQELWTENLIEEQKLYHAANRDRFSRLDRRLHKGGNFLFWATFFVCLVHMWLTGISEQSEHLLTILAASLPAFGAACAGIRSQGEFHRVAQRSAAVHDRLVQLQLDLATVAPRSNELASVLLYECAKKVTTLMANEMLDWRVVFQDRPLGLPA